MKYKSFLLLSILVIACSNKPSLATQSGVGLITPQTSTFNETPIPEITKQLENTPTVLPIANLRIDCAKEIASVPDVYNPKSTMIFSTKELPKKLFTLNLKRESVDILHDEESLITLHFASSPNGNWLAYIEAELDGNRNTINSSLVIISNEKVVYERLHLDAGARVLRWLDNEKVLLQEYSQKKNLIVINPFTGERQNLKLTFPDVYTWSTLSDWENVLTYSPNLSQVVYAGDPDDIILVDVDSLKVITRLPLAPISSSVPVWSPNSEEFIFAFADILNPVNDPKHWDFELYSINKDGKLKQLTNLSSYYNNPRILEYKWSPDGKSIGFWLETDPLSNPGIFEFSILNLDAGIVTNYCTKNRYRGLANFFWSPDNENIVIEILDGTSDKPSSTILLNVTENWMINIGKNLIPIGWLVDQ